MLGPMQKHGLRHWWYGIDPRMQRNSELAGARVPASAGC